MNPNSQNDTTVTQPGIQLDIRIDEAWIRKQIKQKDLSFTIKDREFNQVSISLNENQLTFGARVADKKHSIVGITIQPRWDAAQQQIFIEDVLIQTKTTNLVLKSMGWIASNFMQEKIDVRVQSYAQEYFQRYKKELLSKPLDIPMKGHGMAKAHISAIIIHSVQFIEKAILAKVTLQGSFNAHLQH